MALNSDAMLGMSMRFDVTVDDIDLGSWSTCKGLSLKFKHHKITELGAHETTQYIPQHVEFTKVTLQRAMAAGDWDKTKRWLSRMTDTFDGSTASIVLRDAKLGEVARWDLQGVLPAGWKGPQLDASGKKVALETLELVHEGFLE
jgi:phage tail-like protein